MSASVKIDVNKSFEKYQLDCLFHTRESTVGNPLKIVKKVKRKTFVFYI
jgi:hypothetical protein